MSDLTIFVVIRGDLPASEHMFTVVAPASTYVSEWKKLVYAEQRDTLAAYAAANLMLWKLNNPIAVDNVDTTVATFGPDLSAVAVKMLPARYLSDYFSAAPTPQCLHVIVELPSSRKKRDRDDIDSEPPFKRLHAEREEAFKIAQDKPVPSTAATSTGLRKAQANEPFLNGRPFEAVGPPITIYEPIFTTFRAMNEDKLPVDISPEDYVIVEEFLALSANIYPTEVDRRRAINKPLQDLLDMRFNSVQLADFTSNDGVIEGEFGQNACLLLIRELKKDGGAGDPSAQVVYSYTRWWADLRGVHFRQRTCCPSFLLSITGPWMCVQGGILVGKSWTMQPLTEAVWIGGTTDMHGRGKQIGRLLCSLRAALKALKARYAEVKDTSLPSMPPTFPFITSFLDPATQTEEKIIYEDRLHFQDDRKGTAIFSASLGNGDAVFVKFVTRYNAPAHRLLADEGLAPKLRYCGKLEGGETHFVVVMDRMVGHDMYGETFEEKDLTRVQRAKNLLHDNNYVFGDLRPNNMFKPMDGGGVVLVDFDWCGQDGVDKYPLFINRACGWHPDVKGDAIMLKIHDDYLFEQLRP